MAIAILLVAVGIGVACDVQPLGCQAFGMGIGLKQAVDDFLMGSGGGVREKAVQFLDGRGKPVKSKVTRRNQVSLFVSALGAKPVPSKRLAMK